MPWIEYVVPVAGITDDPLVLPDVVPCPGQADNGSRGSDSGGWHAGTEGLVCNSVADAWDAGTVVMTWVDVTAEAATGVGAAATTVLALGPGPESVGEAANAPDASPALNARFRRIDAPKRVARDDGMSLLALSGHASHILDCGRKSNQTESSQCAIDQGPTSR